MARAVTGCVRFPETAGVGRKRRAGQRRRVHHALTCDTGNMQRYGQYCPLARGAEVLGDRWTLLIIREMLFGVQRFNELERFLPGISRSVLAQRLRHLQRVGLVERHADADGQRSLYLLTQAGRDLRPVVRAIGNWGARWAFGDPDPAELDPDLVVQWISRHLAWERALRALIVTGGAAGSPPGPPPGPRTDRRMADAR